VKTITRLCSNDEVASVPLEKKLWSIFCNYGIPSIIKKNPFTNHIFKNLKKPTMLGST